MTGSFSEARRRQLSKCGAQLSTSTPSTSKMTPASFIAGLAPIRVSDVAGDPTPR